MSRARFAIGVFLLAAFCVPAYVILAGDNDGQKGDRKTDIQKDDKQSTTDNDSNIRPLGKTIKLEFHLHPKDGDGPPLVVHCAIGDYSISREVDEPNGSHSIMISGTVRPVDAVGRVLFTYEADVEHTDVNDDFEARFATNGSAILRIGQTQTLGYLGEDILKVTATVSDADSVPKKNDAKKDEEVSSIKRTLQKQIAKLKSQLAKTLDELSRQKATAKEALQQALLSKQLADQNRKKAEIQAQFARKAMADLQEALQREKKARIQAEAARREAEAALRKLQSELKKSKKRKEPAK